MLVHKNGSLFLRQVFLEIHNLTTKMKNPLYKLCCTNSLTFTKTISIVNICNATLSLCTVFSTLFISLQRK